MRLLLVLPSIAAMSAACQDVASRGPGQPAAAHVRPDADAIVSVEPHADAGTPSRGALEAGSTVAAPDACGLVRPIGMLEIRSRPQQRYEDMTRVVLVTSGTKAVVTTSLRYRLDCANSGCTGTELVGAWLGGEGTPAWVYLPS